MDILDMKKIKIKSGKDYKKFKNIYTLNIFSQWNVKNKSEMSYLQYNNHFIKNKNESYSY